MKASTQGMVNDRPHPGPLPQERGKRSQPLGMAEGSCSSFAFRSDQVKRGIRPVGFRKNCGIQSLSPLPGGEGQGEGGRNH